MPSLVSATGGHEGRGVRGGFRTSTSCLGWRSSILKWNVTFCLIVVYRQLSDANAERPNLRFDPRCWLHPAKRFNTFDYIARVVLDEGVAHYIDWKGRAGADTLFAARLSSREQRAFDQLALACRRLRDPRTDPEAREEILGMAATGPLWSKYGAISGMFAAWRIERGLGRDSLRAAIVGGPRELRRLYAAAAAADTSLKRWPKELE